MTLTVFDLTVARGGIPVLEGLNFALERGPALILRGPNGSGKTTLLRTIAGLQSPQIGRVECMGDSFAYAGHSDGLKTMLSVTENLTFWADVFGKKDISKAVAAFDMSNLVDRMAGSLSAGQKRRLGLARLLVTGRPIWVLDEPTVSLDATSVKMFADAVRTHLKGGGSALMATHIDLGLTEAEVLDVGPFKATVSSTIAGEFGEAFL